MDFVLKVTLLHTVALIILPSLEPVSCLRQSKMATGKKMTSLGDGDLVTGLPSQPEVTFRHYAGYVNVNETNGRALFYWFYEATARPEEKPLVLWLNGGPGCSSVGYGATQEIGPFIVDTSGNGLRYNPYAWNTKANMLFLESPIGVGFSYSNTSSDYINLGDDLTANDAYAFLHKWFLKFPSYRTRTFFIAGESYAGKYVPELAELIHNRNADPSLHIDLQGILLGNPETSDADDWRGLVDYAWSHAVISDETHKLIRESCDFDRNDTWSNNDCCDGVDELLRQYKEIDIYSLYTSVCPGNSASSSLKVMQVSMTRTTKMVRTDKYFTRELYVFGNYISTDFVPKADSPYISLPHQFPSMQINCLQNEWDHNVMVMDSVHQMPRIMGGYDPCLDDYAKAFYNRPDVQKALHVSNGQQLKNWSICNMKIFEEWGDSRTSVLPVYKKLIKAGLRIWVYSGDTDGRVPVLSTRYSLSALGLRITKPWRPWYHQKEVSGWFQEYDGLMFATFRGAGHAVPCFKPSNSLAFFSSFLLGEAPATAR